MSLGGTRDVPAERRRLAAMQAETARLEAAGAQLVVWSETSYPARLPRDLAHDPEPDNAWRIRRGFTVPLVLGAITTEDGHRYNSSLLLVEDRIVARHDKIHRVIGSEWNPVVEWFPSLEGTLPSGFAGGDGPVILPVDVAGTPLRLGAMICLEDIVARYARALAVERPNLLVNQTIDTWFGTFAEPYQHRALAVLRAVEVRADMVRSVNTGPSGLVEATGRLGPQTAVRDHDPGVESVLVEAAIMQAGDTLYATIGELLAWLCVAATIYGWWVARERAKSRAKKSERKHARRRSGR
jgi:apolipoprotein N-acyltransferase